MKLLKNIESFLKKKDIDIELEISKPLPKSEVDKFFDKFYPKVHLSIKSFYIENCNGFSLYWEHGNDCGNMEFDSLTDIQEGYAEFQEYVAFIIKNCIEDQYKNQANDILERMKNWSPLRYEGNGDSIILDLKTGEILFNFHDWFDGFGTLKKNNGIFISKSITEYLDNWSNYCFVEPKNLIDDLIFENKKISFNDLNFNKEFKIEK